MMTGDGATINTRVTFLASCLLLHALCGKLGSFLGAFRQQGG